MEKLQEALEIIKNWRSENAAKLIDEDIDMTTQSCIDGLNYLITEYTNGGQDNE